MTSLSVAMFAFALFDGLRILGFLFQMQSIVRDQNGASAISCMSWLMFAASHFSTAVYSGAIAQEWRLATVFGVNGACCLIIIGLTLCKRRQFRTEVLGNMPGE